MTSILSDLLEVHDHLADLFLRHQDALLDRDFGLATSLLEAHAREIRDHIRLEEDKLIPAYQAAGQQPGGDAAQFLIEHRKLLQLLGLIAERIGELAPDTPCLTRRMIALIELERQYKNLADHHDIRERTILYPALNRAAPP